MHSLLLGRIGRVVKDRGRHAAGVHYAKFINGMRRFSIDERLAVGRHIMNVIEKLLQCFAVASVLPSRIFPVRCNDFRADHGRQFAPSDIMKEGHPVIVFVSVSGRVVDWH